MIDKMILGKNITRKNVIIELNVKLDIGHHLSRPKSVQFMVSSMKNSRKNIYVAWLT